MELIGIDLEGMKVVLDIVNGVVIVLVWNIFLDLNVDISVIGD